MVSSRQGIVQTEWNSILRVVAQILVPCNLRCKLGASATQAASGTGSDRARAFNLKFQVAREDRGASEQLETASEESEFKPLRLALPVALV